MNALSLKMYFCQWDFEKLIFNFKYIFNKKFPMKSQVAINVALSDQP